MTIEQINSLTVQDVEMELRQRILLSNDQLLYADITTTMLDDELLIYKSELIAEEEARIAQEVIDKAAAESAYASLSLTHTEVPVIDLTPMTSDEINGLIASLQYHEDREVERLRVESLEARFDALPDLRSCMNEAGVLQPNDALLKKRIIDDNDTATLELLESTVATVNSKMAKQARLKQARLMKELMDKGKEILAMIHVIHKEIVLDQQTFDTIMANQDLQLLERYLLNGSLGSAKTLITNLDISTLPHTEENRAELLSLF